MGPRGGLDWGKIFVRSGLSEGQEEEGGCILRGSTISGTPHSTPTLSLNCRLEQTLLSVPPFLL